MEHSEKIEITPKTNNFQKHADKLTKLLKIILKLARINGYDYSGRIKNRDGDFIENSNLIQLLNHAMMGSRVLVGELDFIRLLYEANVEPDLIINDNVKVKLLQLYNSNKNVDSTEPKIMEIQEQSPKPVKRKLDEFEQTQIKRQKINMPSLVPYNEIPINPPESMPTLSRYDDENVNNNRKRKRTWIFPDDDE